MKKVLYEEHLLTPSESDAQQKLPLTLLVSQVIELATAHANHLGIGFLSLDHLNMGWVLSRVTVEMRRWPHVGETYKIATWVETFNRHFSERCFSVEQTDGESIGYVRTVWVVIDLKTHASVGTGHLDFSQDLVSDRECPILRQVRHRPFEPQAMTKYTFRYMDLDFYRHVNTVRYVSLLLNQFSLDCYDNNTLTRFEIAFMHEAHFGETATITSIEEETDTPEFPANGCPGKSTTTTFDVRVGDNPILRSRMTFTPHKHLLGMRP